MNPFVVLTAFVALAYGYSVNTPTSAVVCQPLQITWSTEGSSPPYYLSLIPAGQPYANALKQFPSQQGSSFTWEKVDLPPNTSFTVSLKDANGQQAYSAPTTVQGGSDTSCVNNEVMEGGSANAPDRTSPAKGYPGVAAAAQSETSSSSEAAAVSSPTPKNTAAAATSGPPSPKTEAAKMSGGSVSPSQSPSVKASSAARSTPGTVLGIMNAVCLASVVVSVVV
ncbi:hypothetical protein BJV78DRAFT_601554 [Lactifluus subvellereus]|nr:hypothetical protein BJV78DRAFT_601554 [Lactifluus subvellereus]